MQNSIASCAQCCKKRMSTFNRTKEEQKQKKKAKRNKTQHTHTHVCLTHWSTLVNTPLFWDDKTTALLNNTAMHFIF